MGSNRVFDLDGVLHAVDSLVASIDSEAERLLPDEGECLSGPGDLRQKGLNAFEALVDRSWDGAAELRVSQDAMTVWADIYPPSGRGKPVLWDALRLQWENLGVVHGILEASVKEGLATAARDFRAVEDLVVARGTPPVDFYPERWEIVSELTERRAVLDQKAVFLDFKAQSPFIQVKKGDLLARLIPAQPGAPGTNVFGEALVFNQKTGVALVPGKNVVPVSGGFAAETDGCFRTDGPRFWVDEVLVLDSGVGYETGHIDFAGDVHLAGEIAAGFRIWAKFLEGVYAVAQGASEVQTSILNCILQTSDQVILGDKGMIMGGRICAQNGIDAYQIGSDRGAKAELVCGLDFTPVERIAWARDQTVSLVKQLKTLEAFKVHHPAQAEVLGQACVKVRSQILKLNEQARNLAIRVDRNDEASIVVRGVAFPGTYLEICHVTHLVTRPVGRVRFVLDKHRGQIKEVPL